MPKIKLNRANLAGDLTAGTTTALVTIPDGLASAILAGVSPINGLYALMVGTPIAAIMMSSEFMYVANTSALALAVGDALIDFAGTDQQTTALVTLAVMIGLFQLALGLLKLGIITRYVSNAVLVGFMTGIALLIILGQVGNMTGYESEFSNKLVASVDTLFHPGSWDEPTFAVALLTFALIYLLARTRLGKFNMILALLITSATTNLLDLESVLLIGDIADIPRGIPMPMLPDLSLVPTLLGPAIAIGLVGLIQAAGVSKSVPNSDGEYPDASRDFAGQGFANSASGAFQGLPIGGTMSETSVNVSSGAKTRFAGIFSGILIAALVLLFSNLIEVIAMPAVGALLVVAGYGSIKMAEVEDVRDTGPGPRWTMIITFVATLFLPIQYAVFLGVMLSILVYLYKSSADIRLVELVPLPDGSLAEREAPAELPSNRVTLLHIYGSVYFAGAAVLEEEVLPSPRNAERAVVILQLRGQSDVGSTFIKVAERYAARLQEGGGKLLLAGVSERVLEQLRQTETTETIPEDDIFLSEERLGESTRDALAAAHAWLAQQNEAG